MGTFKANIVMNKIKKNQKRYKKQTESINQCNKTIYVLLGFVHLATN